MKRRPKPPTAWDKARPFVLVLLFALAAVLALLGDYGFAAIAFIVALGIATFGGGGPKEGGFYESGIGVRGP